MKASLTRCMIVMSLMTVGLFATGAARADAFVIECNQAGLGCITPFGYDGRSVWGYPVDAAGNNCTNYAAFRLARNGAPNPGNLGNAGSWGANARAKGFRVDASPAVGSIAWFDYGHPWAPSTGHVAYVDAVNGTEITLSDSNWQGGSKRWRVHAGERQYPSGFIHIRDVGQAAIGEGSFVRVPETGRVYRIAGGAPIYVSHWSAFGGPQATIDVSAAQLAAMRSTPRDGTFVSSTATGRVYRIAGGAPIYVSHWSAFGGPQHSIGIDQWALDNIDNPHAHMRRVPADGTFVSSTATGRVYRIAGGAPVYVSHWSAFGGPQPTVGVDQWAFDNIDNPHAHMRRVPADGTFISSTANGRVYRIAGGAPLYVSHWSAFGGPQPTVGVDQWAFDNIDNPHAHLRRVPADGTYLRGSRSLRVFRVAGGAALYVPSCQFLSGCPGVVDIDDWAIDNRDHLLAVPRDGTVLQGLPSGRVVTIAQGLRHPATSAAGAVVVDDRMIDVFPVPAAPPPPLPGLESAPSTTTTETKRCRVPRLKGLALRKARQRLRGAGCKLGPVVRPRGGRRRGPVVVVRQSRRAGKVHMPGTAVGLILGRAIRR